MDMLLDTHILSLSLKNQEMQHWSDIVMGKEKSQRMIPFANDATVKDSPTVCLNRQDMLTQAF